MDEIKQKYSFGTCIRFRSQIWQYPIRFSQVKVVDTDLVGLSVLGQCRTLIVACNGVTLLLPEVTEGHGPTSLEFCVSAFVPLAC